MKKSLSAKHMLIVRCIVYLRVSTEEQARREDNSLQTQENFCDRLIALNENKNWRKTRVITDPGHSAKDLKRPGIQELIDAIKAGLVDVIVIYKLDRLTRSMRDLYKLWEVMEAHGVSFASATESFNSSTPDGRAALNQRMTFAQWEREMTAQRLQDKFGEDARKGKWHPSMVPLGYEPDTKNRSLIVNREDAKIIKLMFKLAADGKALKAISDELNKLGSRSKKRTFNKGRKNERQVGGRRWTVKTVRNYIENFKYKAVTRDREGNVYPAKWEAIVSEKIWDRANHALEKRREVSKRPVSSINKHELVLKEIIRCGHCNKALSPRPGGRKLANGSQRAYYSCQDVIDFGKSSDCKIRNLPGNEFDAFLVRMLGTFAQHPKIIKATLKAALEEKKQSVRPLRSRQRELTQQLSQLNTEIKNLLHLARKGKGGFSQELYEEADTLTEQKHEIETEREQLKAQIHYKEQVVADESTVAEALKNFSQVFYALSFKEREELMGLLIKSLRVSRIDPTKDVLPCAIDAVNTSTPIQYYRIDIEFFIQSIFAPPHASVEANHPNPTASEAKKIRTRMHSTFIVGLIGQRWKSGAFLIHPFKLERDIPEPTKKTPKFRILKGQHILASILEWKSILASWPELHSADVATQVGLSAIRIRHLLKLATLHPEVIKQILSMPPNQAKKQISIRSLRQLCKLDREKQITVFRTIHSD